MNVETYIKRIRNANKKAYAAMFWAWIQNGSQSQEPAKPKELSYMAAQAVRTNLYCFKNYGAQHGSVWNAPDHGIFSVKAVQS
jgi:hypothetical protein